MSNFEGQRVLPLGLEEGRLEITEVTSKEDLDCEEKKKDGIEESNRWQEYYHLQLKSQIELKIKHL